MHSASQTIETTMTSSKETFSHLRMRMEHVGMDAYAITEASSTCRCPR